jgi:phytoene synthase
MRDAVYCKRIVLRHARTFALASTLLPRAKRRGAYAVYAFCRTADDIVDQAETPASGGAAAQRLATYRTNLDIALRGAAPDPILRELAWAVDHFAIARSSLDALLDGVARDLRTIRYQTWADLQRYCQGVASSVGEMCTAVFGVADRAPAEKERAVAHARTLGVAMQLTNILRDIGEDARRGRCYLPEEDLRRFGFAPSDIVEGRAPQNAPAWAGLMDFQIGRARELYRQAIPGIRLLVADAQRCALACASGYAGILTAIERNRYDTFNRRAVVPRADRAGLLVRCWFKRFPAFDSPPPKPGATQASHATA